jgi:prolyl-tRNA synthetase
LLLNVWGNVVRWELRPRLFLRTTEFLWQEGHTAHATFDDARAYARRILHDVYEAVMVDVLALPVLVGRKTAKERFAGAINTLTCEAMMLDGKALQMGTSHELGQNFATVFDIVYLDDAGAQQTAWTTSWGVSARTVGGLIMTHGDDAGIRVPPELAPIQIVVVLVRDEHGAGDAARRLIDELSAAGVRVRLDDKLSVSFGRRSTDWELKGVPLRIEVGPRELAAGDVTLVRRDSGEKATVPITGAAARVGALLDDLQTEMLAKATRWRDERIADAASRDDVRESTRSGWARIGWDTLGREEGEDAIAQDGVTVRLLQRSDGSVPDDGDEPDLVAYCARAY